MMKEKTTIRRALMKNGAAESDMTDIGNIIKAVREYGKGNYVTAKEFSSETGVTTNRLRSIITKYGKIIAIASRINSVEYISGSMTTTGAGAFAHKDRNSNGGYVPPMIYFT